MSRSTLFLRSSSLSFRLFSLSICWDIIPWSFSVLILDFRANCWNCGFGSISVVLGCCIFRFLGFHVSSEMSCSHPLHSSCKECCTWGSCPNVWFIPVLRPFSYILGKFLFNKLQWNPFLIQTTESFYWVDCESHPGSQFTLVVVYSLYAFN